MKAGIGAFAEHSFGIIHNSAPDFPLPHCHLLLSQQAKRAQATRDQSIFTMGA